MKVLICLSVILLLYVVTEVNAGVVGGGCSGSTAGCSVNITVHWIKPNKTSSSLDKTSNTEWSSSWSSWSSNSDGSNQGTTHQIVLIDLLGLCLCGHFGSKLLKAFNFEFENFEFTLMVNEFLML